MPPLSGSENETELSISQTELLSICVSPQAQQGGIGTKLLTALEKELMNRGITRYKVIAGEKLEGDNTFYRKNGFVPAKQITIHGNEVSNVDFRPPTSEQRTEVRLPTSDI